MLKELGQKVSAQNSAMALVPPPSHEDIREALEKLKDPEKRFIDEFFWFWPEEFGQSKNDPALQALSQGRLKTALEIWQKKYQQSPPDIVATHNIAVLVHAKALDLDNSSLEEGVTEKQKSLDATGWEAVHSAWGKLLVSDPFWEIVKNRAQQLNEPALNSGFVKLLRASLPEALANINAKLAVSFADLGLTEHVSFHCGLLHRSYRGAVDVEKVAELALAPTVLRLKEQIQGAS